MTRETFAFLHGSSTGGAALVGLAAVLVLMTAVWISSLVRRDASLVDRFWGSAFVVLAWVYFVVAPHGGPPGARHWLVPALATLWGLRLSVYLTWRNWGQGEDFRYVQMRSRDRSFAWTSLIKVFWLQAAIAWIVGLPLLQVHRTARPESLVWLDLLGVVFFAIGFLFEAVGDLQLTRFKADPANRGRVLDTGLWRYTRHPNYFGNAMIWWGFALIALATPGGWWSLIGPAVMTFFLVRISGVALLEKTLVETKPAYRDYVRRTSAFFPRPPRAADGG